ncbi:MAG: SIS domain-containing protein [Chlamydiae bacterium]|nr:SIS domain-containing protein [Chlamydiota bacterium]
MEIAENIFSNEFSAASYEAIYEEISSCQGEKFSPLLQILLEPKNRTLALTTGFPISAAAMLLREDTETVKTRLQPFQENGWISLREDLISLKGPQSLLAQNSDFASFYKKFSLGSLSTEQIHPLTKEVSLVMHQNTALGLSTLFQVDKEVLSHLEVFKEKYKDLLATRLASCLQRKGRVFLVGSGSSGRIGIDVAAKWMLLCSHPQMRDFKQSILGVIAGGDAAFVRARENVEDSAEAGSRALEELSLQPSDVVVLLSASGSSSFNIGAGEFAAKMGCDVFYMYNSASIPERTKNLIEKYKVTPLLIDLGAQAITGSTRLQAASFAEMALGMVALTLYYLLHDKDLPKEGDLLSLIKMANDKLTHFLPQIAKIVETGHEIFSDPNANFRQLTDLGYQGYVTFLAEEDSLREIMIDTSECAPTFCTNPPRYPDELESLGKKKAEFQAFLLGEKDNRAAWKKLLGRDISKKEEENLLSVAQYEEGLASFAKRPISSGNCVIFVAKETLLKKNPSAQFIKELTSGKRCGAKVVLLVISSRSKESLLKWEECADLCDIAIIAPGIQSDRAGFIHTLFLKQMLNLISNGCMILMNKTFGNQMIDVNVSNNKLIDRAVRFVKEIYQFYTGKELLYETVYRYILHCHEKKKEWEEKGKASSSPIKIALAMIEKGWSFEKSAEFMNQNEENIEKLFPSNPLA